MSIKVILFNVVSPGQGGLGQVTAKSLTSNVAKLIVNNTFTSGAWVQVSGVGAPFDIAKVQVASATPTQITYACVGTNIAQVASGGSVVATTPPVSGDTRGMLFGASQGDAGGAGGSAASVIADTISLVDPTIIRCFNGNTGVPSWSSMSASAVPANRRMFISFKSAPSTLGDPTRATSAYITMRNALRTTLSSAPDVLPGGVWACEQHEPQGDTVESGGNLFTLAQWKQAQINFNQDVVDVVNQSRQHPILKANGMNGFLTTAQLDTYFTPAVLATYDAIGIDCYGFNNQPNPPLDQFSKAMAYAQSKGMRLIVPEIGFLVGGTPTSTTDAQELAVMQTCISVINSYPAANRPLGVMFFNGNSTYLGSLGSGTNKVNAANYWKSVCETQSIVPTSG